MTDLIERLRDPSGTRKALRYEAADEIEQLRDELDEYILAVMTEREKVLRLRAVEDAARHLLAGGDKEAVYHLEKALEALEDDDG